MNNYSQFLSDVIKFKQYETEASNKIKKLYNTEVTRFNDDYKFDFITSDNIKYEVKTDVSSKKSINFYIEFECRGKASGIRISEADYYIVNDTFTYYLIKTEQLKIICKNCNTVV